MAPTTLDPKTALIVIDLRKGVVGLPLVHPIGEVVAQARIIGGIGDLLSGTVFGTAR